MKVIVVGEADSGKTSLCKTIGQTAKSRNVWQGERREESGGRRERWIVDELCNVTEVKTHGSEKNPITMTFVDSSGDVSSLDEYYHLDSSLLSVDSDLSLLFSSVKEQSTFSSSQF